jgi:hypothetical protein
MAGIGRSISRFGKLNHLSKILRLTQGVATEIAITPAAAHPTLAQPRAVFL